MKLEIKHRLSGEIIFSIEAKSWRMMVEAAIKSSANLSYANLRFADLRSANLSSANLRFADLRSTDLSYTDLRSANFSYADLSYADLRFANLRSTNLSYTDLRSANFSYADLRFADLRFANLSYADLRFADLRSANLSSADLRSAKLRSAKGINKHLCTPLTILLDQPGNIRAYKLVNRGLVGPFNVGIKYEIGKNCEVKNANTDDTVQCGAGINLGSLDWCMREWQDGYKILIAEFTAKDIAAIPIATDGKFRVHRCKIVGEKDLKEIGLITKEVKNEIA